MFDKYLNKENVIEITFKDEIPEESINSGIPFVSDKRITILDIYRLVQTLKRSSASGLFIKIKSLRIGYARAYEIWSLINDLRKNGKKVYVYLENAGNTEYFIATSADKIFISPWCTLNLVGLSLENYYLKELLEKLYIEPELEGIGEYKSAAETFNRNDMSRYHREMMDSLLDNNFDNIIKLISGARNIPAAALKKIINRNPMNPQSAKDNNLIDEIYYADEVEDFIKNDLGEETRFIKYKKYKRINKYSLLAKELLRFLKGSKQYIGVINLNGIITQGSSRSGNGYINTCGSDTVCELIKKAREDKSIKGVLIRVLSPGGSALASDLIRNEIEKLNEEKPVVVSMSDVAASGGYMVSVSSQKIFASPFSITGSIGIVAGKFNINKFLIRLGINHQILKRGEMASIYSPTKSFTAKEKKKFLNLIKDMYEEFVRLVSQKRRLKLTETENAAKGRVWISSDAKKMGLIDEIGSLASAFNEIQNSVGWDFEEEVFIKEFKIKEMISLPGISKMGYSNLISDYHSLIEVLRKERLFTIMPYYYKIF